MSGIAMAAGSGKSSAPPAPLTLSYGLNSSSTAFSVSSASGNLFDTFGIVISISTSGGTAPVSISGGFVGDGGPASVVSTGGGNSVGWSGLAVGSSALFHFDANATDSGTPQQSVNKRSPSSGSIRIKRDS